MNERNKREREKKKKKHFPYTVLTALRMPPNAATCALRPSTRERESKNDIFQEKNRDREEEVVCEILRGWVIARKICAEGSALQPDSEN